MLAKIKLMQEEIDELKIDKSSKNKYWFIRKHALLSIVS